MISNPEWYICSMLIARNLYCSIAAHTSSTLRKTYQCRSTPAQMKHGDEMVEAYVDEAEDEQLENDEQEQRNMVRYRKVSQRAVKLSIQSEHTFMRSLHRHPDLRTSRFLLLDPEVTLLTSVVALGRTRPGQGPRVPQLAPTIADVTFRGSYRHARLGMVRYKRPSRDRGSRRGDVGRRQFGL